jgi:hypothetical protein
VRDGERLLCRWCRAAAPGRAAEAARRRQWGTRLRQAVRKRLGGLAAGALITGLLAAGASLAVLGGGGGAGAISEALGDEPAVLQRALAVRYCAGGQGTTGAVPTPVPPTPEAAPTRTGPGGPAANPVITAPTGALVATVAGILPDTLLRDDRLSGTPTANSPLDPMNLVPYRGGYLRGWHSQTGLFPQQVGYELRGTVTVDRVAFQQAGTLPRESWAHEVGLSLSTAAPDAGFYLVGRWTLAQTLAPQEFTFFETPARYARICLYSSHGGKEFVSLGAVVLGVMPPQHLIQTQGRPLLPPRR